MRRFHLEKFFALFFVFAIFSNIIVVLSYGSYPQTSIIPEFWDKESNYCFFTQETALSCVPACVKIMLKSYKLDPLPSQEELALDMKTDLNHTTQWKFTYIPFEKRGFIDFLNNSLSANRDVALHYLKEYVSKNYRIMVITWYSLIDKETGNITHGRVITAYNETGIFFHDPLSGPNRYLHNSDFLELWDTDYGYWALIIKQDVPLEPFDLLLVWIQSNLDIVVLLIVGAVVEVRYVSRISNFTNSIALYLFFSRMEVASDLLAFIIDIYVIAGLIMGLIGLISYISKESLPSEYYAINLVLYNSLTVGLIMLLSKMLL